MTNRDYSVHITDAAKADLRQIHDYILTNFYSLQSADGKVELILKALDVLKTFPEGFPSIASRGYGQLVDDSREYRYFPIEHYIAFFYVEDYVVHVTRILGARQNWAKIFFK